MKTFNHKKALALLLTLSASVLTACQGQNTSRSNPVKGYDSLLANARAYSPTRVDKPVKEPDNTQFTCFEPFKVDVENDQGNKLLFFTEDQESSYNITIRSLYDAGSSWDVKATSLPNGAIFRPVSRQGNIANYKLTWRPTKGRSTDVDAKLLVLRYLAAAESKCGTITQSINLVIKKSDAEPTVSFVGLPNEGVKFGQMIKFQIRIDDPAGTEQAPPDLKGLTFKAGVNSGEREVLNGVSAVDCKKTGVAEAGHWVFDCAFDTNHLEGIKKHLNSGKIVDAAFFATAASNRSRRTSPATPAFVHVLFEKVEVQAQAAPVTAQPVANTAPAAKVASAAPVVAGATSANSASAAPAEAQATVEDQVVAENNDEVAPAAPEKSKKKNKSSSSKKHKKAAKKKTVAKKSQGAKS